ncbi:MAG: 1,4-dihydroxy-2-naphthoate octaprenyltransferase [Bacteroidales bacterium]|nr:1,4-dihydroxy-2-naphthoate octaprenyltransferase [Bacteroidales bacterium]
MKKWIEAMRLRTLPVSISGVLAGISCAVAMGSFKIVPAVLCLLFAMLAQIASNFGNEYYDFKKGVDKKGREGFRRGVTEGDITPAAMKYATFGTLGVAAVTGCMMLFYGNWWMIPVGICIGLFALAYSAGPYPLSHNGLGDVAVVLFFGVVPVTLTCYLQQGNWEGLGCSLPISVAVGMMAANVLIVNNYRDKEDDAAVGKRTTVVIFGRKVMGWAYLLSGILAAVVASAVFVAYDLMALAAVATYLGLHFSTWRKLVSRRGSALNPILGETARNLLIFALLFLLTACLL